ncbi:hypothetical protein CsatB_027512 [Cannabis sativa]
MLSSYGHEPHSKRIKLKLKVEKEILNGVLFQQSYVVEFVQHEHMCECCMRIQANPDQWVAAVQLRQHVTHRYGHSLHIPSLFVAAIKIKQVDKGIDFFFSNRSQGVRFVEFIAKVAAVIRSRHDKQLISHDTKSNNYNYKYTFSVEISPICRENLICLPSKVSLSLGNLGPLVICTKLYSLADAQVARLTDFGKNDTIFNIRTHIGHLLKPGDKALGYDLYGANCNDIELDNYKNLVIPDVILVKKSYEEKRLRKCGKARLWKLKALNMEIENDKRGEEEKMKSEYEQFLDDLEENPDMRFNVSLYHNDKECQTTEVGDGLDLPPSIPLNELLAELDFNEDEDEDEDGDSNMMG